MKVKRDELLKQLEAAAGGLSKREVFEQSSCFVFTDKQLITFNDEVAVRVDSPLKIEGAVQAAPLLSLLRKMTETDIDVSLSDEGLMVKGKGKRSKIAMEAEALLPLDKIETPSKWVDVPEGLLDAMSVVSTCCSTDEAHFLLTCVHVTKDRVEASDDYQIISYPLKTKIKRPMLIRRDSIAKLAAAEPTKWSEGEDWVHFTNADGLVMSCRRYLEDYPDVNRFLEVEGEAAKFPKGIEDALDKAQVFSADNPEGNRVKISLVKGRIQLEGAGPYGWYQERKSIDYDGRSLSFAIEPKLLVEISRWASECVIGDTRISVDAGKFQYVACTSPVEEED